MFITDGCSKNESHTNDTSRARGQKRTPRQVKNERHPPPLSQVKNERHNGVRTNATKGGGMVGNREQGGGYGGACYKGGDGGACYKGGGEQGTGGRHGGTGNRACYKGGGGTGNRGEGIREQGTGGGGLWWGLLQDGGGYREQGGGMGEQGTGGGMVGLATRVGGNREQGEGATRVGGNREQGEGMVGMVGLATSTRTQKTRTKTHTQKHTVLSIRHSLFALRVARTHQMKICILPQFWTSDIHFLRWSSLGPVKKLTRRCGEKHMSSSAFENLHAAAARSTFASQNVQNTQYSQTTFGSSDVETWHAVVSKICTPLQPEAHLQAQIYKTHNIIFSDHFWKFRCRNMACRCSEKHICKSEC